MTARKLAKQKGTWSRMQVIVGGEDVADEVDVAARAARDRRKHHFIELMIQQKEEQKIHHLLKFLQWLFRYGNPSGRW